MSDAERHHTLWLGLAALLVTAAAIPAAIAVYNVTQATARHPRDLWDSTEMFVVYGLVVLALVCILAAARRWRFPFVKAAERDSGSIEPPPGPPSMFTVGHLGHGHFIRSRGHMLRAGRVDTLHSEENVGPDAESPPKNEAGTKAVGERRWWGRLRGHRPGGRL